MVSLVVGVATGQMSDFAAGGSGIKPFILRIAMISRKQSIHTRACSTCKICQHNSWCRKSGEYVPEKLGGRSGR